MFLDTYYSSKTNTRIVPSHMWWIIIISPHSHCLSRPRYIDPVSAVLSLREVLNELRRLRGSKRMNVSLWSSVSVAPWHRTRFSMLESKFFPATWILSMKPGQREARTVTCSNSAPINFWPSPSELLGWSASVTTRWSSYCTVNSRSCVLPPICYWSTSAWVIFWCLPSELTSPLCRALKADGFGARQHASGMDSATGSLVSNRIQWIF